MRRGVRLGLGVFVLASAALLGWWVHGASRATAPAPGPPVLDCPGDIDLGEAESYHTREAVLSLRNTGGRPLAITEIKTDCSCLGVQRLPDRRVVTPTDELVIDPGSVAGLVLPIRVTGVHGVPTTRLIRFRSNDPDRGDVEVRLRYVPTARFFSDPGSLVVGEVVTHRLPFALTTGLYTNDTRVRPTVRQVASTRPDRVRVAFAPAPEHGDGPPAAGTPGSRRFGQVRCELHQLAAGESVDAEVRVYVEGRAEPAVVIPVSARGASPVELPPPSSTSPARPRPGRCTRPSPSAGRPGPGRSPSDRPGSRTG